MAKYEKVSDDIQKVFDGVLDATSIPQWLVFEVLTNNTQKDIYVVKKMSDLFESLTDGLNFVIVINEEILDQLDVEQQKVLFDECLAGVSVSDSDAVSYNKPDFTTFRGVLEKYGHESIITIKESIKSLYDAKKQQEDEEKAAKKASKGKK